MLLIMKVKVHSDISFCGDLLLVMSLFAYYTTLYDQVGQVKLLSPYM
jgi:hypothetical protein